MFVTTFALVAAALPDCSTDGGQAEACKLAASAQTNPSLSVADMVGGYTFASMDMPYAWDRYLYASGCFYYSESYGYSEYQLHAFYGGPDAVMSTGDGKRVGIDMESFCTGDLCESETGKAEACKLAAAALNSPSLNVKDMVDGYTFASMDLSSASDRAEYASGCYYYTESYGYSEYHLHAFFGGPDATESTGDGKRVAIDITSYCSAETLPAVTSASPSTKSWRRGDADIIAFGDSWAAFGSSVFKKVFEDQGLTVDFHAFAGATSGTWSKMDKTAIDRVLYRNPDAQFVWISNMGNDLISQTAKPVARNISIVLDKAVEGNRYLLDRIFELRPRVRVLQFGYDLLNFQDVEICRISGYWHARSLCGHDSMQSLQVLYDQSPQAFNEQTAQCHNDVVSMIQERLEEEGKHYSDYGLNVLDLRGTMQSSAGLEGASPGNPVMSEPTPMSRLSDCYHPNMRGYYALFSELYKQGVAPYIDSMQFSQRGNLKNAGTPTKGQVVETTASWAVPLALAFCTLPALCALKALIALACAPSYKRMRGERTEKAALQLADAPKRSYQVEVINA